MCKTHPVTKPILDTCIIYKLMDFTGLPSVVFVRPAYLTLACKVPLITGMSG